MNYIAEDPTPKVPEAQSLCEVGTLGIFLITAVLVTTYLMRKK